MDMRVWSKIGSPKYGKNEGLFVATTKTNLWIPHTHSDVEFQNTSLCIPTNRVLDSWIFILGLESSERCRSSNAFLRIPLTSIRSKEFPRCTRCNSAKNGCPVCLLHLRSMPQALVIYFYLASVARCAANFDFPTAASCYQKPWLWPTLGWHFNQRRNAGVKTTVKAFTGLPVIHHDVVWFSPQWLKWCYASRM